MKRVPVFTCALLIFLAICGGKAYGQDKFIKKQIKQYWQDQNGQPWNDLSYQMAVRIDPQYAQSLNATEISSDDQPPIVYAVGQWKYFSLKQDAKGTYADVDYLVFEGKDDPVIYQVELQKNNRSVPFSSGTSKQEVRNDSAPPPPIGLKQSNTIFLKDWLFMAGVMLAAAILIYVLIFRWLFSGLLFRRRWSVLSAEHFTWSMSLLCLLATAASFTLFYLGQRLESYVIIALMGAFWLLHGVVWLVSGKQA